MSKKLMRKKLAMMLVTLKKKRKFFCEVEYLENTGVSSARNWISTGIVPDTTTRWEVRVAFNNTSTGKLMGSGFATPTRFNIGIESNKFRFAFNGWFDANQSIITPDTNPHTWIMDATTKTFTIDEYPVTSTQNFGTSTFPIGLFGRCNNASGVTESSNAVVGKIYYSKIWQNGVLVRDMIPVLDWDYVPCMYDKVSGQLFYNQGAGSFTYGREIHYVDYLESTGTQYIDTGLKGKNNIDFDYKCIFTNLDGIAQCVGGNWSGEGSSTVSFYLGLIRTNGNFAYHYDGTRSPVVVMNTTVQDTPYSIQGHMWVDEQYMVINGTKSSVGTITSTFTSSLNMYLFGINNNGLSNQVYMKLYYCKIYDNGVLVRDFIPAIDENGVGYMFDRVSHTIHDNAGTGAFKYPAREVEYLESSGTQYIDTGVKTSGSLKVELVAESKTTSGSCNIFGLYSQNNDCFSIFQQSSTLTYCAQYRYIDTGAGRIVSNVSSPNNKITAVLDKGDFYINGNFIGSKTYYNFSSTQNLLLFAINREPGAGIIGPNSTKVWLCKIYNNDILVRDFIPCYKDGVACMIDKLTGTAYTNKGTGSFSVGRIVESEYE